MSQFAFTPFCLHVVHPHSFDVFGVLKNLATLCSNSLAALVVCKHKQTELKATHVCLSLKKPRFVLQLILEKTQKI